MSTLIVDIRAVDFGTRGEPKLSLPDFFAIARVNARAQAFAVLMAQRDRELRECLEKFREIAGRPGSHGKQITPTSRQAPCFGTERPRDGAACQSTGDDPVGQQRNDLAGLYAQRRPRKGPVVVSSERTPASAGDPKTAAKPIRAGENSRKDLRLQNAGGGVVYTLSDGKGQPYGIDPGWRSRRPTNSVTTAKSPVPGEPGLRQHPLQEALNAIRDGIDEALDEFAGGGVDDDTRGKTGTLQAVELRSPATDKQRELARSELARQHQNRAVQGFAREPLPVGTAAECRLPAPNGATAEGATVSRTCPERWEERRGRERGRLPPYPPTRLRRDDGPCLHYV